MVNVTFLVFTHFKYSENHLSKSISMLQQDANILITYVNILPPNSSSDKELKKLSSLQFAHTLEAIWNLRNKVVHGEGKINLIATIESLEKKVSNSKELVRHQSL